jgi:hypothetical protein
MDADLIRKYRAVQALADTGSPGERENAARILLKLEERYPGIGAAAKADAKRQPDLGADDGWSIPPGVGVPGMRIDGWLRDMLGGLFDSLARDSGIAKLAKPLKVEINQSDRGRLEISATLAPSAFKAAISAIEEDDNAIDAWARAVGERIAAELADEIRAALNAEDDDEDDEDEDD